MALNLFERYTNLVLNQLKRHHNERLSFEQLEELANVPERELRGILTNLFHMGQIEVSIPDGEFPDGMTDDRKQQINSLLQQHIEANRDKVIPVGIANMLRYRLIAVS